MNDINKEELLKIGLQYLDDALRHLMEIKGCEKGKALAGIVHGAIVFGEAIYDAKK